MAEFHSKKDPEPEERPISKKINYRLIAIVSAVFLVLAGGYLAVRLLTKKYPESFSVYFRQPEKKEFTENFDEKKGKKIEEAGKMSESSDDNWWVNSGAWLEISDGTGKTVQGELPSDNKWFKSYKKNNPEDTDKGTHPQNIFRLVTRSKWQNFRQEAFFRINKLNLSGSENRNESNGILLFNRYQTGDDLYYTGLRVDGYAVIKKKFEGDYHTLFQEKIFNGNEYDRDLNPNLLPLNHWIGLRADVRNDRSGNVEIKLYYALDRNAGENGWKLAGQYVDKGQRGDKIEEAGFGGIRTDFMDVEFDDYRISQQ